MKTRLTRISASIRREISIYKALASDPRCPRLSRWLLGAAVAYALSPIDIIPDFIPIIGHLDDLIIIPLLVWIAFRVIPTQLLTEHRTAFFNRNRKSQGPAPHLP